MTNVLTMPIEGNVILGQNKPDQKPIEELVPYLNGVLDDPMIEAIRWQQYTPYFNDGDPCVFSLDEIYVRLVDGNPGDGDHEDGFINAWFDDFKNRVGMAKYDWHTKTYEILPGAANPELVEAYTDLCKQVGSGAFDDALYKLYGDHAIVTIDKLQDKVIIDFYEHD